MSRTIRRKKTTKRHSRLQKDYKKPSKKNENVSAWRFYSDSGLSIFGFEKAFGRPWAEEHGCRRMKWRNEINKWVKDAEYEIIFQPPKQIWDLF